MAHNKDRTRVTVADVDWEDPRLKGLLDKTDGLSIDQRSEQPQVEVSIRVVGGWDTSAEDKPALLVARAEGTLVLATRFPLPHGGDVQVRGLPGAGPDVRWAVVTEEREGSRAEDKGKDIFLNWLRPR